MKIVAKYYECGMNNCYWKDIAEDVKKDIAKLGKKIDKKVKDNDSQESFFKRNGLI